jgi:signal transduction histidine kinase
MNSRIIVIDDEPSILNDYCMILSPPREGEAKRREVAALEAELFGTAPPREISSPAESYEVHTALQGKQGFETVSAFRNSGNPFALAFIDIRMPPGWDGIQTAKKIRDIDPDIEIVIVTAYSDRNRQEIVKEIGTPEKLLYVKKPFDPDEIRQLALCLTRKWDLERKAEQHRQYLEHLLNSVRRLKTLSISSVREVLSAILNEVLYFVNARKGFIARLEQDNKILIEIKSGELSPKESDMMIKHISGHLPEVNSISQIEGVTVFPLRNGFGNFFVLVSDIQPPIPEEKFELLRLLLEASSEVLDSVSRQERFLRNEKIAAIGRIAAGIVHEINNPLTAILGAAELYNLESEKLRRLSESCMEMLKDCLSLTESDRPADSLIPQADSERIQKKMMQYYSVIRDGAERIRVLMGNIRSFSKDSEHFEPGLYDVGEALEDTLMLASNALKYNIIVHKDWKSPLLARCDINGLKQVFLNLILNAGQAMSAEGGELWISGKKAEGKVIVSVRDSGPGIPEKIKERIFEPFYTTKSEGTGLGLSIVKGIIDRHKGVIRVESEPGKGSVFYMEIPE